MSGAAFQRGVIVSFDPHTEHGMIEAADGRRVPFHGVYISGFSSTTHPGQLCEFATAPHAGAHRIVAVRPPAIETRSVDRER